MKFSVLLSLRERKFPLAEREEYTKNGARLRLRDDEKKLYLSGVSAAVFLVFIIWLFVYLFFGGHADDEIDRRARVAAFIACLFGIVAVVKFAWEVQQKRNEEQKRVLDHEDHLRCEVIFDPQPFPEGRLAVSLYNKGNFAVSIRRVALHCEPPERTEVVAELKAFCRVDPPEPGVSGLVTSRWQSFFVIEPRHPVRVFVQPSEVATLLPLIAAYPNSCTFIAIETDGGYRSVIPGEQIGPVVQTVLAKLAKKA